jgi:PmbA protein
VSAAGSRSIVQRLDDIVARVLERAVGAGADAADAVAVESDSESVGVRCGTVERVSEAHQKRVGLRVFVGQSCAVVSSADLSAESLARLAMDAVAFARVTAPDPHAGLPDPADVVGNAPDLDLYDARAESISTAEKIALATEAEAAAFAADAAITNSEGAEFTGAVGRTTYGNSLGFVGHYSSSRFSLHVVPVATRNGTMQRDFWYTAGRRFDRLESAHAVGVEAARRTVRRLGARKVETCQVPVVFDPEAAGSLLGHLAAAVSGSAVYRGTSFLRDKLGQPIAVPELNVDDDGTIPAALGSKPFDGEGVATRRTTVVRHGVLQSYLLDSYAARKLGLRTTGNAARAAGDAPAAAPTNLLLRAGTVSPRDMIASVDRGLYVTEFIGYGVNMITGDYSRGAAGLWIERGELTHAVEEVTIAGNLLDMFRDIEMIGNDLVQRSSISAPSLKIGRMTVAGS